VLTDHVSAGTRLVPDMSSLDWLAIEASLITLRSEAQGLMSLVSAAARQTWADMQTLPQAASITVAITNAATYQERLNALEKLHSRMRAKIANKLRTITAPIHAVAHQIIDLCVDIYHRLDWGSDAFKIRSGDAGPAPAAASNAAPERFVAPNYLALMQALGLCIGFYDAPRPALELLPVAAVVRVAALIDSITKLSDVDFGCAVTYVGETSFWPVWAAVAIERHISVGDAYDDDASPAIRHIHMARPDWPLDVSLNYRVVTLTNLTRWDVEELKARVGPTGSVPVFTTEKALRKSAEPSPLYAESLITEVVPMTVIERFVACLTPSVLSAISESQSPPSQLRLAATTSGDVQIFHPRGGRFSALCTGRNEVAAVLSLRDHLARAAIAVFRAIAPAGAISTAVLPFPLPQYGLYAVSYNFDRRSYLERFAAGPSLYDPREDAGVESRPFGHCPRDLELECGHPLEARAGTARIYFVDIPQ
jgi:hypothetical protein